MAGRSQEHHERKLAKIKQRGLKAAEAANGEPADPKSQGLPVPVPPAPLKGEVLPPEPDDVTRTALKRAMRKRAQEYAEKAITVLAENLGSTDPKIRQQAANDLLAWGFGKPATEIEAGEGAQMIVIQKFRDDYGTT